MYIRGSVQGYPVLFTTDTGASKTVLSKIVFDAMRPEDKPALGKSSRLMGAGDSTINEIGKGKFKFQLGPVRMHVDAIVAEIDDDGLLGGDVLQNAEDGPTDPLMSRGVLKVRGEEVPIIQVGLKTKNAKLQQLITRSYRPKVRL
ncbi:MAG: retroviral-like aspartic protease family protein [Candidatus Thiodiazotropha taylori]|nr:retroviral-like aspartic protease family protein [Candidatus Thiodiazotropha taylori]